MKTTLEKESEVEKQMFDLLVQQQKADEEQQKSNTKFNKLSKTKKRIGICKDVLEQLKAKSLIAKNKVYVISQNLSNKLTESCDLQSVLPGNTCQVCAKGALFISDVTKRNNFKTSKCGNIFKFYPNEEIQEKLSDIFDKNQLDLIETAFEKDVMEMENEYLNPSSTWTRENYSGIAKKAILFGKRYPKPKDRLAAIMRNMIKNKGIFKP